MAIRIRTSAFETTDDINTKALGSRNPPPPGHNILQGLDKDLGDATQRLYQDWPKNVTIWTQA